MTFLNSKLVMLLHLAATICFQNVCKKFFSVHMIQTNNFISNNFISINNQTRLPKSYHRFQGLIEKLFLKNVIEVDSEILMKLQSSTLSDLISKIKPTQIIGLTTKGQKITFDKFFNKEELLIVFHDYLKLSILIRTILKIKMWLFPAGRTMLRKFGMDTNGFSKLKKQQLMKWLIKHII